MVRPGGIERPGNRTLHMDTEFSVRLLLERGAARNGCLVDLNVRGMRGRVFAPAHPRRPSRGPERNPKGVQTASYEQLLRGFQNYQGKSSDEPSYGALLFFNERTVQALRRA